MKFIRYVSVLLFVTVMAQNAQAVSLQSDGTKVGFFVRSEFGAVDETELADFKSEYAVMLDQLRQKRATIKSDELFLKHLFYKVHRKFLGTYEQGVSFHELLTKRQAYDCVTGTALYGLFLDDLGIPFQIRETDYHVYLLTSLNDRTYLMESTDPLYGFAINSKEIAERQKVVVTDAKKINERLSMSGLSAQNNAKQQVKVIDNAVTLRELAGLQYYNQALRAFNAGDLRKAYQYIVIAQGIYPSTRIKHAASFMFAAAFGD